MDTVCIVCQNERDGKPAPKDVLRRIEREGAEVSDDVVIRSIRRVKKAFNIAQNNRLVVCPDCMDEHVKKRKNFEKWLVIYGALGATITLITFLVAPDKLRGIFIGLLLTAAILLFGVMTYYHPALKSYSEKKPESGIKRKAKK